VSHHLATNAVVLHPPRGNPGVAAPDLPETTSGGSGTNVLTISVPGGARTGGGKVVGVMGTGATGMETGKGTGAIGKGTGGRPVPRPLDVSASASVRRLPPLDLANLSLRQRAEMDRQAKLGGADPPLGG
jgi:hypothetical protein